MTFIKQVLCTPSGHCRNLRSKQITKVNLRAVFTLLPVWNFLYEEHIFEEKIKAKQKTFICSVNYISCDMIIKKK